MFAVNDTATELDKQEERLCKAPPPLARSLAAQCLSPCGHQQASLVLFQNKPPSPEIKLRRMKAQRVTKAGGHRRPSWQARVRKGGGVGEGAASARAGRR